MITSNQYLILFIATFILVGAFTPLMRKLALRTNFVDHPNMAHKSHHEPIPYLGGAAIALGIIYTTFVALRSQENMRESFWTATS